MTHFGVHYYKPVIWLVAERLPELLLEKMNQHLLTFMTERQLFQDDFATSVLLLPFPLVSCVFNGKCGTSSDPFHLYTVECFIPPLFLVTTVLILLPTAFMFGFPVGRFRFE